MDRVAGWRRAALSLSVKLVVRPKHTDQNALNRWEESVNIHHGPNTQSYTCRLQTELHVLPRLSIPVDCPLVGHPRGDPPRPCRADVSERGSSVLLLKDADLSEFRRKPPQSCFSALFELTSSGKPFIHPDGSAVVYSPATVAPAAARNPQQGKTPQQPIPAPTQQQPTNHLHSQVSGRGFVRVSSFK